MHTPIVGSKYSVIVSKENFDTVIAQNYVPQKVKINSFDIIPFAGKNDSYSSSDGNGFGVFSKISITFSDPANTTNYYEIGLKIKEAKQFERIYTYENIITNEAYYPTLLSVGLKKPFYLPFNDKKINGKTIRLDIFHNAPIWDDGAIHMGDYTLQIYLRSVTEEYYKYHTTLLQHLYKQQEDIIFGMAEPINAYSNIENGYGVFAGFNEDVVEMYIEGIDF